MENLKSVPPHEARKRLSELEKQHAGRRGLVWAELGQSPLALALKPLSVLAEEVTANALAAGTAEELGSGYGSFGWRADDAVL